MRRTKIVATIGPATRGAGVVRKLVTQVDVFRINFSHGDRASHLEEIRTIRSEARRAGRTVAILQDLPGPKIRVGKVRGGAVDLARGARLKLVSGDIVGDSAVVSVNYPELLRSVKKGDYLHLADGVIRLRVEENTAEGVSCAVVAGGTLSSGKGVNAPGVKMKIEYPTQADAAHLKLGVQQGVDYIAASFVRSATDLRKIRRLIPKDGPLLIAKIEKKEAVANFGEILEEADGIMVARGDLGIEVPIETVPVIQKTIIGRCNAAGKPVIVATQMLVSMVNFPVPSRAEVTDVSTAILDGTDAVMLSDETTVGKYPIEAVRMLDRIARSTEKSLGMGEGSASGPESSETGAAIARAACRLAGYVGAKAIVAPTQTGSTARRVSMFRPRQPIVAMCTESRVARQLTLCMGVIPFVSRPAKTMDSLFERADDAAEKMGLARRGERIVVTSGTPGIKGTTNLIKVSVVGSRA
ncbi:MAG: pyruvate kinase [Nitrososphaerota archaeon]|nr:pyruvate kinase [Nitrososphaerota archaeon]